MILFFFSYSHCSRINTAARAFHISGWSREQHSFSPHVPPAHRNGLHLTEAWGHPQTHDHQGLLHHTPGAVYLRHWYLWKRSVYCQSFSKVGLIDRYIRFSYHYRLWLVIKTFGTSKRLQAFRVWLVWLNYGSVVCISCYPTIGLLKLNILFIISLFLKLVL